MHAKKLLVFLLFGTHLYTMERTQLELLKVHYKKHRAAALQHFEKADVLFCISHLYAGCAQKYAHNAACFSLSMHISLNAYQSGLYEGVNGIYSLYEARRILKTIQNNT